MTWFPKQHVDEASQIDLNMAAGSAENALIFKGEVFARGVRRPLIPLGKLIERTGLVMDWKSSGCDLKAVDGEGSERIVLVAT
eukprot:4939415-Amphidinium_carterae.1